MPNISVKRWYSNVGFASMVIFLVISTLIRNGLCLTESFKQSGEHVHFDHNIIQPKQLENQESNQIYHQSKSGIRNIQPSLVFPSFDTTKVTRGNGRQYSESDKWGKFYFSDDTNEKELGHVKSNNNSIAIRSVKPELGRKTNSVSSITPNSVSQHTPIYRVIESSSPVVSLPNLRNGGSNNPQKNGLGQASFYTQNTRKMPRVTHMEAECSDDVMRLRIKFNTSFQGLVYSAGYSYDEDCVFINGTGADTYEFYVSLNRCGTLGSSDHNKKLDAGVKNTEPTKNYMWNTLTIQYNPMIEEEWDEHFKVTCEYGYDFWKTVTFPFLDVEVDTADPIHFTLTPPECHMEIRGGYGTSGARITTPVHVGDPLTLMIYMRSQYDGFDIVVNDCYAHNGADKRIQLIDHHGCPLDEKLISKFQGTWSMTNSMYETAIYAHMKTFRFTGTPALYLECDIRMCHGRCPTQSCNWRSRLANGASVATKRNRRSAALPRHNSNETDKILDPKQEDQNENVTMSENVSLSRSLHVLQSRRVDSASEQDYSDTEPIELEKDVKSSIKDDTICLRSIVFALIIGSLSLLTFCSSLVVSLLYTRQCGRVASKSSLENRHENMLQLPTNFGQQSCHSTLSRSHRSEYIHSPQTRIP